MPPLLLLSKNLPNPPSPEILSLALLILELLFVKKIPKDVIHYSA